MIIYNNNKKPLIQFEQVKQFSPSNLNRLIPHACIEISCQTVRQSIQQNSIFNSIKTFQPEQIDPTCLHRNKLPKSKTINSPKQNFYSIKRNYMKLHNHIYIYIYIVNNHHQQNNPPKIYIR